MKKRLLALLLSLLLIVSCFPLTAFAADETLPESVELVEGDVRQGFVPEGTPCTSSDPSVAWVDGSGSLNALKEGTATLSVEGMGDCTVTVGDYTDGSPVIGSLKILARYNDSMQFYDGHVYLLFTSYQDDVTIAVPDLYAGYTIDSNYYNEIAEDISIGSHRTDNDAGAFFELDKTMKSVTLDRGEIVTIGMYRDFDLSVTQAALGAVQNSSAWKNLTKEVKTVIVTALLGSLSGGELSAADAFDRIKAVMTEAGQDYRTLLDGVVAGGVCFNRELYNQKLEYDQFENVTYEMDITENQLKLMTLYLGGNLNKFSMLKNSCATVALRAWNAAVGTRSGADTAYKLDCTGEGIFALADTPKGVRDNIVARLPGYYLNNAEGVAEPDAGYEDECGWVYVSAPEKVTPVEFICEDDAIAVETFYSDYTDLLKLAKGDKKIAYAKDAQKVNVAVDKKIGAAWSTVNGVDFEINGATVSLTEAPEEGVWFRVKVNNPEEGKYYTAVDVSNKTLECEYDEEGGVVTLCAETLPLTFKLVSNDNGSKNILRTTLVNGDCADTEIYYYKDGEKITVDAKAEVEAGAKLFIRSTLLEEDWDHILHDIEFNYWPIMDEEHYDADEDAYFIEMPEFRSEIKVIYEKAELKATGSTHLQISVGDVLDAAEYNELTYGEYDMHDFEHIGWWIGDEEDNEDGAVELVDGKLKAVREGTAYLVACATNNRNINVLYTIEVYDNVSDMVPVTFDENSGNYTIYKNDGAKSILNRVAFSGYLVKPGTPLEIEVYPDNGKTVLTALANNKKIPIGEDFVVTEATKIDVRFADAVIEGMPGQVNLEDSSDSCQLDPAVKYTGLLSFLPVYDPSITYESSDPLVAVDENGLITVAGEIPEGGLAAYVTAYAGSSNHQVYAETKVIVGDYDGDDVVGRLTIYARRIYEGELVPHGAVTFTTYEDVDLDISYYEYYKPDDRYKALMTAYEYDTESFPSDPALYSDNELGLEDRESYFEIINHGAQSEPDVISLQAGESVTLSNYSFDPDNFSTLFKTIENGTMSSGKETQIFLQQLKRYRESGEIDGEIAFDSMVATLAQIYRIYRNTGYVAADGHSLGGLCVNRELYNEFRRNDLQTPSHAYSVEITADELALLKRYIADPVHNFYSLFNMNCASGAVILWNAVLLDRPEYALKGNYTGFAIEPMSLYYEIEQLGRKDLDGEYIVDFYPRSVAYVEMPGDADRDGEITVYDASLILRYLAGLVEEDDIDLVAADVDGDGDVTVYDASLIQRYLAGFEDDWINNRQYEIF